MLNRFLYFVYFALRDGWRELKHRFFVVVLQIEYSRWSGWHRLDGFYCACGKQNTLGICPECGTESGADPEDVRGLL